MDTLKDIKIHQIASEKSVDASIIRLTRPIARQMIDAVWWNISNDTNVKMQNENDKHWEWVDLFDHYGNKFLYECVAVISQENYIEGAMIYQFNAKSKLEPNLGSVYIDRLASAPQNRNRLVNKPIYKGVGSELTYWAVQESYMSGLGGRVTLQSLPTPDTIKFYEKKGFVRTDLTQPTTGLVDYELPKIAAEAWLRSQGDLP